MAGSATVVLTGATSGIGRATAALLAARGDHLILHGRHDAADVEPLLAELRTAPGAGLIDYLRADFTRLDEVVALTRRIAELTDRVDVLINNAARPGAPVREVTADGHEAALQVNYLAPVLLTERLRGPGSGVELGRVVNLASATHISAELLLDDFELAGHPYDGVGAYAHSKLALVTYTCWLAAQSVEAVSVHTGIIATPLLHAMFPIEGRAPETAAEHLVELAGRHGDAGVYYDERRAAAPHQEATDADAQARLHELTASLLAAFLAA